MAFTSYLWCAGAMSSNTGRPFVMEVDLSKPTNQTQIYKDSICGSDGQGVKDEPVSWIATESYLLLWNNKAEKLTLVQGCQFLFSWQSSPSEECKQLKSKTLPTLVCASWEGKVRKGDYRACFFTPALSSGSDFFNHEKFFLGSRATSNTRS